MFGPEEVLEENDPEALADQLEEELEEMHQEIAERDDL
jgi:hypothetical protein